MDEIYGRICYSKLFYWGYNDLYIYIYFTSNIFNALITNITMEEEIAWVIKRLQNNRLKILGVEKFKFLCK